ncbi:MAG: succinylglutamate desuccinylase/aspartoacylase family protein [Lachnospiraceae bacterium]|nr:succinylglutamate desuccinylase/aspartoacylase family protein [Lachnospiraceae bacterium]
MKKEFKIGPLTAAEGEKVSGYLPIVNAEVEVPITLINGRNEGKTILICGGLHNAEYVGIQSAIELADELDPENVSGNIIVIRLLNRTGFEHRTMSLVYEDGKNINRVFPGSATGTLADQIAYTLEKDIYPFIDFFIDLHCGDGYEGLVPYVYCLGNASDYVVETSRKMADIVQVDYLVVSMLDTEGAYNYAGSLGIPSILIERGCKAVWDQALVEEDKKDVKNILRYLGILGGEVQRTGSIPKEVNPVIYENAPVTGCWYPSFQPGDTFKEGDVIGVIKDYFGNVLFTCYAKQNGIVLYEVISLCIIKDGPMITYGAWDQEIDRHAERSKDVIM